MRLPFPHIGLFLITYTSFRHVLLLQVLHSAALPGHICFVLSGSLVPRIVRICFLIVWTFDLPVAFLISLTGRFWLFLFVWPSLHLFFSMVLIVWVFQRLYMCSCKRAPMVSMVDSLFSFFFRECVVACWPSSHSKEFWSNWLGWRDVFELTFCLHL